MDQLTIRRWEPGDAAALHRAIAESVDHLRPWVPFAAQEPRSLEERLAAIEKWREAWDAGGDRFYGVFVGDVVVGGCGLHRRIGEGGLEIGYWTHAGHVRRGIATTAARIMTDHAFAIPGVDRVEIWHDRANAPSARIPMRLGFEFAGEMRRDTAASGTWHVWRMTRGRWRERDRPAGTLSASHTPG